MNTVIVVDDEHRIIRFLSRALSAEGHRVRAACSGRAALSLLHDQPVDLVLPDLILPQSNGLQILTALRTRDGTTPVIVLSGVADMAAPGAIDFVATPFHTAELIAIGTHTAGGARVAGRRKLPVRRRGTARSGPPLGPCRRARGGVVGLGERELALQTPPGAARMQCLRARRVRLLTKVLGGVTCDLMMGSGSSSAPGPSLPWARFDRRRVLRQSARLRRRFAASPQDHRPYSGPCPGSRPVVSRQERG